MKNKSWSLLALLFTLVLVLAACTNDEGETKETDTGDKENTSKDTGATLPLTAENEGEAIDGGTLLVGMVKDEPFQGIFSYTLYEDAYDAEILGYSSNSLFEVDADFLITDEGIGSIEVDQDNNKVLVKIKEGVKWSDGEPLIIADLIQPYLIIGHKDYKGIRYDDDFKNIVGAQEYNAGTADTISGLKEIDKTTLEISFKKLSPAIFSGGDGLWGYAEPSHIVGDIPVDKLLESDEVRTNPVTLGAFKFDKIVPGESVQLVANENYWKGQPKIDKVVIETVPTSSISKAIENGNYDLVASFATDKYPEIEKLENTTILGRPELYYAYLGFKLGKYDYEKSTAITDLEGSKVGDVKLRQAMGYALNIEEVAEFYYHGLRERANSLLPPVFKSFYDKTLEGYTFDPDKANELLDEAGYKDVDGDGIREDKDGQPLEIKFATMSGGDIAEDLAAFYIQNWKEVGLNVTLTTGRTIEFNSFYEKVQADDPEIDIFMAAWGTGTNPSPAGIFARASQSNFTRYSSEKLDTLLANIDSPEAFDTEYRAGEFRKWQEYMTENASIIPTMYRYELVPVNKRVKNYSIDYAESTELQDLELTAEEPIK